MSEKKLREFIRRPPKLGPEGLGYVEAAEAVLAAEPDVVKAAKRFKEQAAWAVGTGSITAAHWADYCLSAAKQLEEDFAFCLAETGWEWTDD